MKVEVFMQVNSVSVNNASFGHRQEVTREMAEQFAQMDDKTLRKAAYQQATIDTKTKKHQRIHSAIYWSIPIAAGLATAIKNPAKTATKILNVNTSRLSNLSKMAGTTLGWAGTFALINTVFGASRKLENSNKKAREFTKEHPTLSFVAKVGASLATLGLATLGVTKLASKAPKLISGKKLYKFNSALNNSKVLNKVSEGLAKVPSAIKGFAKGVAEWSPMILVLTSISHSLNHARALSIRTAQNYDQLKDSQAIVREQLAKEAETVDDDAEV